MIEDGSLRREHPARTASRTAAAALSTRIGRIGPAVQTKRADPS